MKPNISIDPESPYLSIGSAARQLGISVHTMRMYERAGLIVPFKKSTNQRLYSDGDIKRLRCVRKAIHEDKISIEGIRRILSLTPCWAVVRCPIGDREQCPAYLGHAQPCWSMDRKGKFCKTRDCRTCEVYNDLGDCQSIKDSLKKLLPG